MCNVVVQWRVWGGRFSPTDRSAAAHDTVSGARPEAHMQAQPDACTNGGHYSKHTLTGEQVVHGRLIVDVAV